MPPFLLLYVFDYLTKSYNFADKWHCTSLMKEFFYYESD
jgi:hypothetical protein